MRIDWKAMPSGIEAFDAIPDVIDWADPTHVPLMVAEVVHERGNPSDCLDDGDEISLQLAAIDAMPDGEASVRAAVATELYALAEAGGWSEWLFAPGTRRYPWESWEGDDRE